MKEYILRDGRRYKIRVCNGDDTDIVMQYINTIASESDFLTFGEGEFNVSHEDERSFIESCKQPGRHFIIAELDGKVIGNLNFMAGGRPRIKHCGELGVSVLREYWGNRIGEELIKHLIDWAIEGGYIKKINLRVREDNTGGIKLYERLGFEFEGRITKSFYVGGRYYDTLAMGLEL